MVQGRAHRCPSGRVHALVDQLEEQRAHAELCATRCRGQCGVCGGGRRRRACRRTGLQAETGDESLQGRCRLGRCRGGGRQKEGRKAAAQLPPEQLAQGLDAPVSNCGPTPGPRGTQLAQQSHTA